MRHEILENVLIPIICNTRCFHKDLFLILCFVTFSISNSSSDNCMKKPKKLFRQLKKLKTTDNNASIVVNLPPLVKYREIEMVSNILMPFQLL